MNNKYKKLIFLFSILLFVISCYAQQSNPNIALGQPRDSDSTDDFLIFRTQYVVSFNPDRHVANWVSWNLNSDWYGDAPRYTKFLQDPELPKNIYQAKDKDYSKSGYDKGHIVRSEERTATEEDNITTFYYTNVMPQTPDLNRGIWLQLERYCEYLCKKQNKELYIIAGGIYHEGYNTIGNEVAVPDSCFKIIVVLDRGEGLENINNKTLVIAVVMPNQDGVRKGDWHDYTTSVDRIEWSTGYNFLSDVSQEIQDVIEN